MSEQSGNGFVPLVPEFDQKPQPPQFMSEAAAIGGAAIPFGFDTQHSTPVIENGFDVGPSETRTNLKTREDTTSGEYLPL